MLREATSLSRLQLFEGIAMVGVAEGRLPAIEQIEDGLTVRRFGPSRQPRGLLRKVLANLGWSVNVFRAFRAEPVACINCHSVAVLPLCALLKGATGAKLVYDPHELESEANGLTPLRKLIARTVERILIGRADHCIFVGDAIRDWYVSRYRLREASVLYNCPRLTQPAPSDHFRTRFGIGRPIPVFLYQGILGEGRGLHGLIGAFSTLQGRAALVIMGYGPMTDWVREQTAAAPNIHYHDPAPPAELLGYTAAADFGLSIIEATSLSYEYSMPNKLFEYLMAGKPVLVSPTLEQKRVVTEFRVGAVTRDTTAAGVRDGVLELLALDRKELESAVAAARETYCWERQERLLEQIYTEDLGFGTGRRSAAATADISS